MKFPCHLYHGLMSHSTPLVSSVTAVSCHVENIIVQLLCQITNALILPGKSYELVSFAAQKPDATVFLPSGSETKPSMMKYQLTPRIS